MSLQTNPITTFTIDMFTQLFLIPYCSKINRAVKRVKLPCFISLIHQKPQDINLICLKCSSLVVIKLPGLKSINGIYIIESKIHLTIGFTQRICKLWIFTQYPEVLSAFVKWVHVFPAFPKWSHYPGSRNKCIHFSIPIFYSGYNRVSGPHLESLLCLIVLGQSGLQKRN